MSKIPRVLWFMYMWQDLPEWGRQNIAEFHAMNPGWDVRLVDSLPREFPGSGRAALALAPTPRYKADIVRYWLLHEYGGVYCDIDCRPLRPLDDLLATVPETASAFFPMHLNIDWISDNFFIGGEAGEAFWLDSYTVCCDRQAWKHKPCIYFGAMNAYPRNYPTETVHRLPAGWCVDRCSTEDYGELFDRAAPMVVDPPDAYLKHYRVCGRLTLEAMQHPEGGALAWEPRRGRIEHAPQAFKTDFAARRRPGRA